MDKRNLKVRSKTESWKKILEITIMTRSSRKGKGSGWEREGRGVREGKGERGKELSRLDPKHQIKIGT